MCGFGKDRRKWEVDHSNPAGSAVARTRRLFATEEEAHRHAAQVAPRLDAVIPIPQDRDLSFSEAFERYFKAKARKRSLGGDRRLAEHLLQVFGAATRLRDITAPRIARYREARLAARSIRRKGQDGTPARLSAASINRPLALLRHLLRLACDEWEVLPVAPKVRLEREPQGRVRWLEQEEEQRRLLKACRASGLIHLGDLVTVALETGMRRGEVEGMTWDRVDLISRSNPTRSHQVRPVP